MVDFIFYHTPIFYLIQSVWRDEAFSYFMAKPNLLHVVTNTINDFNPPLYYLLLHFWIQLTGRTDEMLRLLSFIPHLLSVYIAYHFAKKIFSDRYAIFVTIFTLFNPMLLYYAFEMRMYSWYSFFVFSSVYFLYIKNWKLYTITTVLGLYTHSFFPLIIFSNLIFFWITGQFNKKNIFRIIKPFLIYLPWLPILINQFIRSKDSWMFPVDLQLIKSVLGNLFINYEGTPGGWWNMTAILSGMILMFIILSFHRKKNLALFFSLPIFIPLVLILSYSIVKRPIYVNRYMIFITIYEIMAISLGVWNIRNKLIKNSLAIFWLSLTIYVNLTISPYHKKTDFKTTFIEINKIAKEEDYVFSKTPIGFLESAYYYKKQNRVFVYNPNNVSIPNYIGVNVVFPEVSKTVFPNYPSRTFLVDDDSNFEIIINR